MPFRTSFGQPAAHLGKPGVFSEQPPAHLSTSTAFHNMRIAFPLAHPKVECDPEIWPGAYPQPAPTSPRNRLSD